MLSVIVPAFNEGENINAAVKALTGLLNEKGIAFEVVFADDGSADRTWEFIEKAAAADSRIRGIKFSRNFGKEGAIFAGLSRVKGDCAVVIDCDLQHPPELIPEMYALWEQGAEVVEARKANRGRESLIYKAFAKAFYGIMKSSSDLNLDGASDFKLLDRKVIDALNALPERLTFFRALSAWVGFKTVQVEFEVKPRAFGKTKWSFKKLFKFAVSSVTGFTNLPMQLMTAAGLIFLAFAAALGVQTLVNFFSGHAAEGFSTVVLLLLLIGSLLMLGLGIIGYYLSKIYEEIKFRPRYIIERETPTADRSSNPGGEGNDD
ncbi:MAG: glycosyltransferase family 2 protein [Oscillospiraceae bacterium]|jgi:dolichol-phosphate mannosyltransferase|nr:glycosyltransferase family 2 protein [Oscillospiraceae bacterium]